ncbi:3736_t:CDS:1, partial [Racocetra fulgida]
REAVKAVTVYTSSVNVIIHIIRLQKEADKYKSKYKRLLEKYSILRKIKRRDVSCTILRMIPVPLRLLSTKDCSNRYLHQE